MIQDFSESEVCDIKLPLHIIPKNWTTTNKWCHEAESPIMYRNTKFTRFLAQFWDISTLQFRIYDPLKWPKHWPNFLCDWLVRECRWMEAILTGSGWAGWWAHFSPRHQLSLGGRTNTNISTVLPSSSPSHLILQYIYCSRTISTIFIFLIKTCE